MPKPRTNSVWSPTDEPQALQFTYAADGHRDATRRRTLDAEQPQLSNTTTTADDADPFSDQLTRDEGATKMRRVGLGRWLDSIKSILAGIGILCLLAQLSPQCFSGPSRQLRSSFYTSQEPEPEPLLRPIDFVSNMSHLLHHHQAVIDRVLAVTERERLFDNPGDLAHNATQVIMRFANHNLLVTPAQIAKRRYWWDDRGDDVLRARVWNAYIDMSKNWHGRVWAGSRPPWHRGWWRKDSAAMARDTGMYLRGMRNVAHQPDHYMEEAGYLSHLGDREVAESENATAAHVLKIVGSMVWVPGALESLGSEHIKDAAAVADGLKGLLKDSELFIVEVEAALAEAEKNAEARGLFEDPIPGAKLVPGTPIRRSHGRNILQRFWAAWASEEPDFDMVAHVASVRANIQQLQDIFPRIDEGYAELMAAIHDDWPQLEVQLQAMSDAVDLFKSGQGWYRPLTPHEFYCGDDVEGHTMVHFYAPGAIELAQSMDKLAALLG